MATVKAGTLMLTSGKQIKLSGGSLCITPSLEIGDGFHGSVFYYNKDSKQHPEIKKVANPHNLTAVDIQELSDYMITLWMSLKENIRLRGIEDHQIFKEH